MVFSQERETVYQLTRTLVFYEYDFSNDPPIKTEQSQIVQKGTCFKIDHSDLNGHFITFLKWKGKDNPKNEKIYAEVNMVSMRQKDGATKNVKEEKIKYYKISNADFNDHAELYVDEKPCLSFVTGAITIPIKIRPGGDRV
jgi:hypothetical protein